MRSLPFLLAASCIYFGMTGCGNHPAGAQDTDSSSMKPKIVKQEVPEFRERPKPEPAEQYQEKTDDKLNDWYFSVQLFETPMTFNYLIKMQFEEVRGEDTLRLPNLGSPPKPVLKKGPEKYSCLIGFLDDENKFREYKLVHLDKARNLKLTTLKHYSVSSAP